MSKEDAFEIDFAGLKSQAADMIEAGEATPAVVAEAPSAPAVIVDKAIDAPAAVAAVEELDPEKDGDRLVRVKIDGQWETKKLSDVTGGYSRTSHFTRQMQDLAAQRKQVETFQAERTQLLTEREKVKAFLANPNLVAQYLQHSHPQLFETAQQPVGNPDEIATVAQAQELINRMKAEMTTNLEKVNQSFDTRVAAATKALEDKQETAQHTITLNATVKELFEAHPILKKVRLAEDILRYEVAKLQPKTIEEAVEGFKTVAQGMAEDLQEGFTAQTKTKAVAKAKLAAAIEPPGGSGPQIQPTSYKKADGTTDWNKLKTMAAEIANQ